MEARERTLCILCQRHRTPPRSAVDRGEHCSASPFAEHGANKDNHCIVKRRHLDAHTNATAVRQVGSSLMVL